MTRLNDQQARRLQRLAARADALLVDEDFKLVLADLKNGAIHDWAEGKDTQEREDAWFLLQAVTRLENNMRKYGETWRTHQANHG